MNKSFLTPIVIVSIIVSVIALCIFYQNKTNTENGFNNALSYNQYRFEPYFSPDIYIVPGQAKLGHNVQTSDTSDYLPYESAIPAVDVLRANKQILPPNYYSQVIKHNTTPYSVIS